MSSSPAHRFISIEKYLHTSYRPDVDYVDGVLEDRLWGEWDHSVTQGEAMFLLDKICEPAGMMVLPSLRIRVSPTRVRNADVCILGPNWIKQQVVEYPPALCVEILSTEETLDSLRSRAKDFLLLGVPEVWILDPVTRSAYVLRGDTMAKHDEDILRLEATPIVLSLSEVYAALDE